MAFVEMEKGAGTPWREYYALRKRARLSALALIFVLVPVAGLLLTLLDRLNLPAWAYMTIFLGVNVAVIVLFSLPTIKWANWRCPRCGKPFAQPTGYPGSPLSILVRFFLPSCCANCKLPCGAALS